MRHAVLPGALIAGLLLSIGGAQGQSPGTVTATCKDGTAFTGAKRAGACFGHGGVQTWGAAFESSGLVNPAIEPAVPASSSKSAAQAPSAGPVTATCKDGTAFTGAKRAGACRGHGGVQSWGTPGEATTVPVNAPAEPVSPPASRRALLRRPSTAARFGSIPTATSTTAPVRDGTARPSRALTCPRPRRRLRAPSRTTERRALHKRVVGGGLPSRLRSAISAKI